MNKLNTTCECSENRNTTVDAKGRNVIVNVNISYKKIGYIVGFWGSLIISTVHMVGGDLFGLVWLAIAIIFLIAI